MRQSTIIFICFRTNPVSLQVKTDSLLPQVVCRTLELLDNYHVTVWSMVAALFPNDWKGILDNPKTSPQFPAQFGKNGWIPPDVQLAIFNNMNGVSAYILYQWL